MTEINRLALSDLNFLSHGDAKFGKKSSLSMYALQGRGQFDSHQDSEAILKSAAIFHFLQSYSIYKSLNICREPEREIEKEKKREGGGEERK